VSRIGVPLQALELGANLQSVLVAEIPVFLQTLGDNALQLFWHFGLETKASNRTLVHDGVEDGSDRLTPERRNPCGHLIEHHPEREQIAPCIQRLSQYLFRGLLKLDAAGFRPDAAGRYPLVNTAAKYRSSDSTSAGSATVSAISCWKSSRYRLRSL
jgi:hypothetical protein